MKAGWIFLFLMTLLFVGCATTPPVALEFSTTDWGTQAEASRAVYDEALAYLAKGRQRDAEEMVASACETYPDCRRLWFFRGILALSRSDSALARASLANAHSQEDRTLLSQVAYIAIGMDMGLNVETGFQELGQVIDSHPDEMLIRWLYAMETSRIGLHAEEGGEQFEILLKEWKIAPVMLHHSYAKLLTTHLVNPEKALEHRLLATELEPSGETYRGLAYTLKAMKRYDEANQVYAKMLEMEPGKSIYWIQWGSCLVYKSNYAAAADKFEQAYICDPSDITSLLFWGRSLEEQGKPEAGFAKYAKAVEQHPQHQQAKAYAAHSKLYGYGTKADFEWALETCVGEGAPAIEILRYRVHMADKSTNPLSPIKSRIMLKHLTALGKKGDPDAQYSLGMLYRHGIGVAKDVEAADKWLKQAADNGHEIAKRMINPPL